MTYEQAMLEIRRLLNYMPPEASKRVGFLVTEDEYTELGKGIVEYHKKLGEPIAIDGEAGWPKNISAITIGGGPVVPWS